MKVIIVRPNGYSGGSLVIEKMCSLLREKGVDARIFQIYTEPKEDTRYFTFWIEWLVFTTKRCIFKVLCRLFPNSKNARLIAWRPLVISPVRGVKRMILPFFPRHKTIIIYPDKIYGNFLRAKYVVRYLLYHYPYSRDPKAYEPNDLFIAYREIFNDKNLNPDNYVVQFNHFDNHLYRQYNFGKRSGNCYIIRKGRGRPDLPTTFDGPIIDDLAEEEKVRILNECSRCYSYDTQTFYTSIASVCGCLPIIRLEDGQTKENSYGPNELPLGVAFDESQAEIEYAERTRPLLLRHLDYTESNDKNVRLLINILENRFGPLSRVR